MEFCLEAEMGGSQGAVSFSPGNREVLTSSKTEGKGKVFCMWRAYLKSLAQKSRETED